MVCALSESHGESQTDKVKYSRHSLPREFKAVYGILFSPRSRPLPDLQMLCWCIWNAELYFQCVSFPQPFTCETSVGYNWSWGFLHAKWILDSLSQQNSRDLSLVKAMGSTSATLYSQQQLFMHFSAWAWLPKIKMPWMCKVLGLPRASVAAIPRALKPTTTAGFGHLWIILVFTFDSSFQDVLCKQI